jgi:hypothetical protein
MKPHQNTTYCISPGPVFYVDLGSEIRIPIFHLWYQWCKRVYIKSHGIASDKNEVFTLPHIFHASPRYFARTPMDSARTPSQSARTIQLPSWHKHHCNSSSESVRSPSHKCSDSRTLLRLVRVIFHSIGLGLKSVRASP